MTCPGTQIFNQHWNGYMFTFINFEEIICEDDTNSMTGKWSATCKGKFLEMVHFR